MQIYTNTLIQWKYH